MKQSDEPFEREGEGRMKRMKDIHVNLLLCKYLSSGTRLRLETMGKLQGSLGDIAEPLTPSERNPSQQEADREEGAGRKKSDLEGSWKEPALLHPFCQGTENRIKLYTNYTRMFLVKLLILLINISHHYTA